MRGDTVIGFVPDFTALGFIALVWEPLASVTNNEPHIVIYCIFFAMTQMQVMFYKETGGDAFRTNGELLSTGVVALLNNKTQEGIIYVSYFRAGVRI